MFQKKPIIPWKQMDEHKVLRAPLMSASSVAVGRYMKFSAVYVCVRLRDMRNSINALVREKLAK